MVKKDANLINMNVLTDKIEKLKHKYVKNSINPIFPKFSKSFKVHVPFTQKKRVKGMS